MAYTANTVYLAALALCDYYDESGTFDTSPIIKSLKAKAPYLCDIGQRDLIYGQGFSNLNELNLSSISSLSFTNDGYKIYKLPPDCITVVKIIEETISAKRPYVYLNYLFVDVAYTGIITLIYKSMPNPIKVLSDTFSLNDNIVMTCLPYYLAANFLAEENPTKSALYIGLYEKAKLNNLAIKEPYEQENINNDY